MEKMTDEERKRFIAEKWKKIAGLIGQVDKALNRVIYKSILEQTQKDETKSIGKIKIENN